MTIQFSDIDLSGVIGGWTTSFTQGGAHIAARDGAHNLQGNKPQMYTLQPGYQFSHHHLQIALRAHFDVNVSDCGPRRYNAASMTKLWHRQNRNTPY